MEDDERDMGKRLKNTMRWLDNGMRVAIEEDDTESDEE